jgi:chemotaxis regulatin CheY-phosphate phosphatase CheZ
LALPIDFMVTLRHTVKPFKIRNMSENTHNPLDSAADGLKAGAEKAAAAAGETWDAAKKKMDELGDDAEKVWDKVEDKAEDLWDKAKSGELADDAKDKLNDLAEGAKGLWGKLVDKLDGDKGPEDTAK